MQVVRHASIRGTTLSTCCCDLPLRCLDFVLQSIIYLFFCFLSLFYALACNSHTNTEAHKMCCNSKSTSERSNRQPTKPEAFTLSVENAFLGPNATPQTELLSRHKDRGEVQIEQKTQNRWRPCQSGKAWTRLELSVQPVSQEIGHRATRGAVSARCDNLRNYRRYYRFNSSFYDGIWRGWRGCKTQRMLPKSTAASHRYYISKFFARVLVLAQTAAPSFFTSKRGNNGTGTTILRIVPDQGGNQPPWLQRHGLGRPETMAGGFWRVHDCSGEEDATPQADASAGPGRWRR